MTELDPLRRGPRHDRSSLQLSLGRLVLLFLALAQVDALALGLWLGVDLPRGALLPAGSRAASSVRSRDGLAARVRGVRRLVSACLGQRIARPSLDSRFGYARLPKARRREPRRPLSGPGRTPSALSTPSAAGRAGDSWSPGVHRLPARHASGCSSAPPAVAAGRPQARADPRPVLARRPWATRGPPARPHLSGRAQPAPGTQETGSSPRVAPSSPSPLARLTSTGAPPAGLASVAMCASAREDGGA